MQNISFLTMARSVLKVIAVGGFLCLYLSCSSSQNNNNGNNTDYRDPAMLKELIEEASTDFILIDVRGPGEYADGYIPGAVNIPLNSITENLPEVPKDSLVIVYCLAGGRSAQAATSLQNAGYSNVVDFGGIRRWEYPLQKE